ncbi:Transcriptional activator spt7 [Coemansia sp. RSA 2050]|nr:Transcriptional activator spt7 [Coemansia sp. RSA 2050]KAJ2737104.1 Transcriptional activator spt7 [Coemansia sp. BCRC 34962]
MDLTGSWSRRSYQIALRLHERGEWSSHLAEAEVPWVTKALESPELWDRFISPRAELWRFHSPPPPIFDLPPAAAPSPAEDTAMPAVLLQRQSSETTASVKASVYSGKRVAHQDGDSAGAIQPKAGKRARAIAAASMESDDDMLSVLSGSDIDMAIWANDTSVTPNPVSPGSATDTALASSAPDTTGDLVAAEGSLVCALAAFHARSAIFEQYVSALCGLHNCAKCTEAAVALGDVVATQTKLKADELSMDTLLGGDSNGVEVPSLVGANMPEPLLSRNIDEDEEYDDDSDGDVHMNGSGRHEPMTLAGTGTQPNGIIATVAEGESSHARTSAHTLVNGSSREGLVQANSDSPDVVNVALHSVFRTLDEMVEVVRDQNLCEGNIRQIKDVMQQRAAEPKDMLVTKLGSLQNMKNLAQFIDNHRDSVNLSTRELSHLLSEVRPKRTKWANDRRVGQVELYDALEHVLNELKNMGEASVPFHYQVKRKDAPDYLKVIKNPMDLAAMAKNLRNEVYNSKRQFFDHLQLIRDNCYTYNTEPGNYYRKSADALLAKARQLMDAVPDIVVREKSNGMSNGGGGDDVQTECGDESGNESQGARTIYGNREGSVMVDEETPAPGLPEYSSFQSSMSMMRASVDDLGLFDGAAINALQQVSPPAPPQQLEQQRPKLTALAQNIVLATSTNTATHISISEVVEGYDVSLGEKIWRSKTRKRLASYLRQVEQDGAASSLGERHAFKRTAEDMRAFDSAAHDTREPVSCVDIQAISRCTDISSLCTVYLRAAGSSDAAEARRRNEELDWRRKEWLQAVEDLDSHAWKFVSECEPAAGLPQLETLEEQVGKDGVLRWLNDDCEATVDEVLLGCAPKGAEHTQPSIEAYAAARFPDNAMWRAMADNVECLKRIRDIDNNIWANRLNIPVGMLQRGTTGNESARARGQRNTDELGHLSVRDIHGDYATQPDPPQRLELDSSSARQLLQRTNAFMLAHVGFEAATSSALTTMSDFFIDFVTNLGRTLRSYSDKHGRTMSSEAILAHSLYANGVEDLSELEYYMRGEVGKHNNKLLDLQRKISKSYQDTMADGRLDAAAPPDVSVLESDETFITGSLNGLGDLGEDFFGFKELGLDKEFGLEQLTVPQRLWHGKSTAITTGADVQAAPEEVLAYPKPEPWAPIATPHGQIGLIHQFLCEKLKAANGGIDPPGYEGVTDGEKSSSADDSKQHTNEEDAGEPLWSTAIANELPEQWVPIVEDEKIPTRARFGASRPKVPPPNYLTHPRTHMHIGSGQPTTTQGGRSAKKKPAKTTTAAKTTTGSKSVKKK